MLRTAKWAAPVPGKTYITYGILDPTLTNTLIRSIAMLILMILQNHWARKYGQGAVQLIFTFNST